MFTVRPLRALVTLAAVVGFTQAASAGPPLICHPFVTDAAAPLLPWIPSRDWHSPDPSYDVTRLASDTLRLLSPDAAIIDRMENLRRAAIYADRDPKIAAALLDAVLERTKVLPADPRAAALAWFDAGYLIETYRQLDLIYVHDMRHAANDRVPLLSPTQAALDGYSLAKTALAQAPSPELEFAASLMTDRAVAATHRAHAKSGAVPESLLAQNLEVFWLD